MFTVHLPGLFLDLIVLKHYQNNSLETANPYTCLIQFLKGNLPLVCFTNVKYWSLRI